MPLTDDFAGTDGQTPDARKWTVPQGSPTIQSNQLQIVASSTGSDNVRSRAILTGDFDVQIDFALQSPPSANSYNAWIRITINDTHVMYVGPARYGGGNAWQRGYRNGGSWVYDGYGRTGSTGAVRIVRVGTQWTAKYKDSGTWYQYDAIAVGSGPVTVVIGTGTWDTSPTITAWFDNFSATAAGGVVSPVTDAGPDQNVEQPLTVPVTLAGSATDDGLPDPPAALTYLWTQVSGPGTATFDDATDPTTDVTFDATGTYVLRLTADDSLFIDSDDVSITITGPPAVDAGPDQTVTQPLTLPVTLAGSATDDGLPDPPAAVSYLWTQVSGPGTATFDDPTDPATDVRFNVYGVYVLRLSADDSEFVGTDDVTITIRPLGEVEFLSDASGLLIWLEWSHVDGEGDPQTLVFAKVPLADPATYYGGWKDSRVMTWGKYRRALSDRLGQYEVSSLSWSLSDTDRLLRAMLADPIMRYVQNRTVAMRMIDDAGRRRGEIPRLIARGIIRNCKPTAPLLMEFTAEDFLSSVFSTMNFAKQIPQRVMTLADFPALAAEHVGKPVPILYGDLSDDQSAYGPVAGVSATPRAMGTPVTNVTLVAATDAGGTCAETADHAATLVYVTAVDTDGVEYDPDTWPPQDVSLTDGENAIDVDWDTWSLAGKTLDKYRVYYRAYPRDTKVVEVAAGTTSYRLLSFDIGSVVYGGGYSYVVTAMCADGETVVSAVAFASVPAKVAPAGIDIEWDPLAEVEENYYVYRMWNGPGMGTDGHRWMVLAGTETVFDSLLDDTCEFIDRVPMPTGILTPIYAGTVQRDGTWWRFVLAGHAVKGVTSIYQLDVAGTSWVRVPEDNYGITWLAPGRDDVGGTTLFPCYVDINGHRYAVIYVRGPEGEHAVDGTRPFRVNVQGIEDVGDGSGELITDLHSQYLHACQNWLFQSYLTGAWLISPDWPADVNGTVISQVDDSSFAAAAAIVAARLPAGYIGAWALGIEGEQVALRDVLAMLNLNSGVESGFNRRSQFFICMLDPDVDLDAAQSFTQATDIIAGSFEVEDNIDELFNRLPYAYRRHYASGVWLVENEAEDTASIVDYREPRADELLELRCVRDAATAADLVTQRLARTKEPPRLVRFLTPLRGLSVELGDVIVVDHIDGIGASGWTQHSVRVLRHELDPERLRVSLECVDVERLLNAEA